MRAREGTPPSMVARSHAAASAAEATRARIERPWCEDINAKRRPGGAAVGSRARRAARASLVGGPDRAAEAQLTVVDADVEPAVGVAADPGLVGDRCAIAAVVAHREQVAVAALSAGRKLDRLRHSPSASSGVGVRAPSRSGVLHAEPGILALEGLFEVVHVDELCPCVRRLTDQQSLLRE